MIDYDKYRQMLLAITPKYTGKVFPVNGCPIELIGNDIQKHIQGCDSILISAATLGEEFDRLLRQIQVTDMAGAVILDMLAGEYIEDFCNERDKGIRFSPGYGDFPLSTNRDIVKILDTQKRIGLCVTDEFILTPQKSITGITGIT